MSEASTLHSQRLAAAGFTHGFSTRHGGVSAGAYATLNLGRRVGDDLERLAENHRRIAAKIGYDPARLFEASQVHGVAVLDVGAGADPDALRPTEADALVAHHRGDAVGIRTADCVPILIGDRTRGTVAAVHAGWRGVVAGVVARAVDAMHHADRGAFVAAIGPSIGPCCFEVGDDVADSIVGAVGDDVLIRTEAPRPHVDLWLAVEHQLRRSGIEIIDTLGACTRCEHDDFYSFRRDGPESGRMLSVIVAGGAE